MKATEVETERRAPAIAVVSSSPPRVERLVSLDALRGFDMFWITGGTAILFGLGKVVHRPFFNKFLEQFDHVPWQGLHFFDLIWPLFMFIMGAAIPLGVARTTGPRPDGSHPAASRRLAGRRYVLPGHGDPGKSPPV